MSQTSCRGTVTLDNRVVPEAAVAQLELCEQVTFEGLSEQVSSAHGKPVVIRIVPDHAIPGVSGLWVESAQRSVVLVRSGLSELHRMHVILHEFGHILLRHEGCDGLSDAMPSIFQHVGHRKGIRNMLSRSPRWNELEIAAEQVAYLLSHAVLDSPEPPTSDFERVFE